MAITLSDVTNRIMSASATLIAPEGIGRVASRSTLLCWFAEYDISSRPGGAGGFEPSSHRAARLLRRPPGTVAGQPPAYLHLLLLPVRGLLGAEQRHHRADQGQGVHGRSCAGISQVRNTPEASPPTPEERRGRFSLVTRRPGCSRASPLMARCSPPCHRRRSRAPRRLSSPNFRSD